jgi:hypothetical protein
MGSLLAYVLNFYISVCMANGRRKIEGSSYSYIRVRHHLLLLKLIVFTIQSANMNIWIWAPPPKKNYRSSYAHGHADWNTRNLIRMRAGYPKQRQISSLCWVLYSILLTGVSFALRVPDYSYKMRSSAKVKYFKNFRKSEVIQVQNVIFLTCNQSPPGTHQAMFIDKITKWTCHGISVLW